MFKGKFGLSRFAPPAFLGGANIGHSTFVNSEKNYIFFYKTLWGICGGNLKPAPKLKNFTINLFNFPPQRKFQKCPDLPLGTVVLKELNRNLKNVEKGNVKSQFLVNILKDNL